MRGQAPRFPTLFAQGTPLAATTLGVALPTRRDRRRVRSRHADVVPEGRRRYGKLKVLVTTTDGSEP